MTGSGFTITMSRRRICRLTALEISRGLLWCISHLFTSTVTHHHRCETNGDVLFRDLILQNAGHHYRKLREDNSPHVHCPTVPSAAIAHVQRAPLQASHKAPPLQQLRRK